MAEIKTQKTKASAVAFINSVSDEVRRADAKKLLKIFKDATGLKPVIWGEMGVEPRRKGAGPTGPSRGRAESPQRLMGGRGIIGFGSYHYKSERSAQEGDWMLTGFSPRKANLTVYIMPGFKDFGPLLKKLGKHKISGGSCVYINKLSDIDIPTLTTLIKKSVQEMKKRHKV